MDIRQPVVAPAYQLLAENLRTEITSGRLRSGQRLPTEPELCARTGLSRGTVREALRLLASQNLVTTVRGVSGGSFVTQPSVSQLTDMLTTGLGLLMNTSVIDGAELLEMRAMLEVPASGLAAERRTSRQLAILDTSMFDLDADDVAEMLRKHRLFHLGIAPRRQSGLRAAEPTAVPSRERTGSRFPSAGQLLDPCRCRPPRDHALHHGPRRRRCPPSSSCHIAHVRDVLPATTGSLPVAAVDSPSP